MAEQKRRWGDRRDATLLRDVDSLHFIMGIIYPNRADNEAYIAERVNLGPIKDYIATKNYEGIPFKYTFFHVILTALVKTVILRPKLNRFYANENYYQRNKVTAGFVIKKEFADGLTWVYTGDLGVMDEQGFIYFRGRAKRMIISSGYNVYPGQIENILDAHEYVQMSCVIGVPDPYKMQKVKAFVKLAQGVPATEETKQVLMAYCRKNVAKYAMPYDIEFKEDMPKTLVGKVAYRQLEEEELAKIKAAEEK